MENAVFAFQLEGTPVECSRYRLYDPSITRRRYICRMRDAFYGEETTKRIEMVSFEGKEAIFV